MGRHKKITEPAVLESQGIENVTETEEKTSPSLSELEKEHEEEAQPEKKKRRKRRTKEAEDVGVSFDKEEVASLFEDVVIDVANGVSEGLLNTQPLVKYEEHMAKIVTRANIMALDEEDMKKAPGIAAMIVAGVIFIPRLITFLDNRKRLRSRAVETA